MKTKAKVLVTALCAVLLVAVSVFGTIAYLTGKDTVTNTFTVGSVNITLDEAEVNPDGTVKSNSRVKANTYHLLPGHSYVKDPTVHVGANSEDCWIFVKLDNGLKSIVADTSIEAQMTGNGWTLIDSTNNVYAYRETVSAGDNITVFESFTLKGDAEVSGYANAKIEVIAYAVQADGFSTAEAAWQSAAFLG
ncbi:MAG: SipW-dependent-type signal peptide-containing protein [Clostridia bacterium]|nr:SipW-dependent-type signal peptide-containing protein [Clostridia bacterium]